MSLAFCAYDLTVGVDGALQTFARIVDYLGLSHERVRVDAPQEGRPGRLALGRLASFQSLFSDTKDFSLGVVTGDPLDAEIHNMAPYVSYQRVSFRDQMTVFSPHATDLREFAERFMGGIPAQYGFGMDWNRPGSFFCYASGFGDFESTRAGIKDRWGEIYLYRHATLFDRPVIRDIYPVNLLTKFQLDWETPAGTVRDFILAHKDWGEVTPLAENWFMWWVPPGMIGTVKAAFESRRLLTNRPWE